jgi:HSP20 family protein
MARDLFFLMQTLFLPVAERYREVSWRPAADVYRTAWGWLLKFELAGVHPEDITLTVSGNRITVHGTRRDCLEEAGCHVYRMEIDYSHFERTIELPDNLERARIAMKFDRGMLLVPIQTEEAQP